jgi:signal transduction histidine kinase
VIRVENDGPGIAPERIETLFEPFVRGEASRSLDSGGAGLGLSIARSVLRAHGGEVTLENRAGGGLVATARLPLAPGGPGSDDGRRN